MAFEGEACLARALSPSWGLASESHARRQVGTETWVLTAAGSKGSATKGGERAPSAGQGDGDSPGARLPCPHLLTLPTEATGRAPASARLSGARGRWEVLGSVAGPVLSSQEEVLLPGYCGDPGDPSE